MAIISTEPAGGVWRTSKRALAGAMLLGLAGCVSVSPEAAFTEVAMTVGERSGKHISWSVGPHDNPAAEDMTARLLNAPLTGPAAVQVALLNNRDLQATYADLGLAQAALVQAKQLPNPVLDGAITFPEDGGVNLAFGAAMSVIQVLYIPLKKRVAESELEKAKLQVASEVLGVAGETHRVFIDYQASLQAIELFKQVLESTRAAVEAASSLREAGNITALQFETQAVQLTEVKLELAAAESRSVAERERLNVLMGLHGRRTQWRAVARLPDVPGHDPDTRHVERRAIEASLDLAAARQGLISLGRKYRLAKANALVPDLDAGGEWERDDGEVEAGPTFEIQLPLFDWGRAKKAAAQMEIVRARDTYTALAVKIRSAARLSVARLDTARRTAAYYRTNVIPQTALLLDETQREFNAMQRGVFDLIQAKERQIRAGQRYVDSLADYWRAHVAFTLLMQGKLPGENGGGREPADRQVQTANAGGH